MGIIYWAWYSAPSILLLWVEKSKKRLGCLREKSLSSELYVWFKSQDFEMTLGSCKLKLWEAAVHPGKSMLPCYMYWKNTTEKLDEGFDGVSFCDYLCSGASSGKGCSRMVEAPLQGSDQVSYRTSDGKVFVPTLEHSEVCTGAAGPQSTLHLLVSGEQFECVQAPNNTVLYQLQLLVAAWWHSAGVKNLSSHFHSALLSHGWIPPLFMLSRTMGYFQSLHNLPVLCLLRQLSLHGGSSPLRECDFIIAMTFAIPWITPTGCGTRALRGWTRGTA